MDSTNLSEAIIHEWQDVLADEIHGVAERLMGEDVDTIERDLQRVSRIVWGRVLRDVLRLREQAVERPRACPECGGALRLVRRGQKEVRGLVGDAVLVRETLVCRACHRGCVPFDEELGLGTASLTPGLARVVARVGLMEAFREAAEVLDETLGLTLPSETIRTMSEAMGAVAEAENQERMAAIAAGTVHESDAGVDTLLVEMDGVHVPLTDGWREMKIGRVAALGPDVHVDAQTGRAMLRLGSSVCGGGTEEAESFLHRLQMLAIQAGLGDATRHVVILGDGAAWIWSRIAAFFAFPHRQIIEIVDIFHAYEHLWTLGHLLFPDAATCTRWVEQVKETLYDQGASAVLTAFEALSPSSPEATECLRVTRGYFTAHAARMAYPQFVARQLPIGSGAIESLCKNLVQKRAKGAGMRWSETGIQQIVSLRALHQSDHWAAFWARHPLTSHARRWPRQLRALRPVVSPTTQSAHTPVDTITPPPTRPPTPPPVSISPWRRGPSVIPRCA